MAEQEKEDKSKVFDNLTGTQKSAILMMLLGEDEASEILKNLTPKEVQHLGGAMYSVEGLDQDTVNKVLDEFLAIIKEQTSLGLGAGNYIQNVLNKALGQDRAQSILGRITPTESNNAIEILEWMDSRAIAELIQDEHPQIIALIISYLEPAQGSDVLVMLDEKNTARNCKKNCNYTNSSTRCFKRFRVSNAKEICCKHISSSFPGRRRKSCRTNYELHERRR